MLDEHEIGMGHEIQSEGHWITLEEFFAGTGARLASAPAAVEAGPSHRGAIDAPSAGSTAATVSPSRQKAPAAQPRQAGMTFSAPSSFSPAAAGRPRYRLLYALLGILLGFLGLHNYYARHWLTGLLQLLLSIATYLLGFGVFVPWLWAMVEAAVVRKDGEGREMR